MRQMNIHTMAWYRSPVKRLCLGGLVLGASLAAASPCRSAPLVEVDEDTNDAIQMAAKVGGKIPLVGPYLSPVTSLMFGTADSPSYAEMRAEWEGYTDKQIEISRRDMLGGKLEGYRKTITAIQELIEDERKFSEYERKQALLEPGRKRINLYPARIMEEWKSLQRAIVRDRPLFISGKAPAAPLLPMLGAVVNMQIDALDQQYTLAKRMPASQPDFLIKPFREHILTVRAREMAECNKELKTEILKTANERIERFKVRSGRRQNAKHYVSSWWVDDGETQSSRRFVANGDSSIGPTYRRKEKRITDTALYGFTRDEASEQAEAYLRKVKADEYARIVSSSQNLYLIQDSVTLQVDGINPALSPDKFREIFARQAPVTASGLLIRSKTNPSSYMLIRWSRNLEYAAARSCTVLTGTGYVTMSAADARYARGYWNSTSGQQRQRGEIGLTREVLTKITGPNSALKIEEVRGFDPWAHY